MIKKSNLFLLFALPFIGLSQNASDIAVDSLYREDQVYFGITYNTLMDTPEAYTQTNFSPGLKVGFIRDFPINKKRNIAVGVGLGYAVNTSAQNLKITPNANGSFDYEFLTGQNYQKNRFSYQVIEIPFEFRWRTSTAQSNKFWRIYTGLKASHIIASRTFFKTNNETTIYKDLELNPWQYGLTLSAGYNNWNAFIYYGLNPIFETASMNQNPLEMKSFKVGLMFYIL